MTGLLIRDQERLALRALRVRAAAAPVDMRGITERLATPEGKAKHVDQMTAQTVAIPLDYLVTFSIEVGHPGGTARHLSVTVGRRDRYPLPGAIWLIAAELGFVGGLAQCDIVYPEQLSQGLAVNVIQSFAHADQVGQA